MNRSEAMASQRVCRWLWQANVMTFKKAPARVEREMNSVQGAA